MRVLRQAAKHCVPFLGVAGPKEMRAGGADQLAVFRDDASRDALLEDVLGMGGVLVPRVDEILVPLQRLVSDEIGEHHAGREPAPSPVDEAARVRDVCRHGEGPQNGVILFVVRLSEQWLEVLPHLTRLAILINPTNPAARPFVAGMTQAARNASIDVTIVEVSRPEEFAQAYASLRNARADWLHVVDEPMISSRRAEWVAFASAARLPLSSDVGETARLGGLISYAPSSTEHYLLAAVYVDKILQGAKPADLPVQEPTRYELILNLKTANTLGLTIPRSVLLRAQEVIQ